MQLATTPMTVDKQVKRHPIVQEMQESIQAFRAIGAEIEPDLGLSRLKRAARSWQRQHFGARRQMTKTEATTEASVRRITERAEPPAKLTAHATRSRDPTVSADVYDAPLGCFLGRRLRLCRKLKHRCLLTLMQVRQEI